jgi:hypothetical protein
MKKECKKSKELILIADAKESKILQKNAKYIWAVAHQCEVVVEHHMI